MWRNEALYGCRKIVALVVSDWEELVEKFSPKPVSVITARGPMDRDFRWTPPLQGGITINVDAAFRSGDAAIAMVARNWKGELLKATAICTHCSSVKQAELKALIWAAECDQVRG